MITLMGTEMPAKDNSSLDATKIFVYDFIILVFLHSVMMNSEIIDNYRANSLLLLHVLTVTHSNFL